MTLADKRESCGSLHLPTDIATPEKAALSQTTTLDVANGAQNGNSPCRSAVSTPRSDRSNPFETDIEAFASHSSIDKPLRKSLTLDAKTECQVWPGKDHWKKQAKQAKMQRSCTWMARLSPRGKIIAKVLIIVFVVGAAVGIGFGVSKPLGAPIWGKNSD